MHFLAAPVEWQTHLKEQLPISDMLCHHCSVRVRKSLESFCTKRHWTDNELKLNFHVSSQWGLDRQHCSVLLMTFVLPLPLWPPKKTKRWMLIFSLWLTITAEHLLHIDLLLGFVADQRLSGGGEGGGECDCFLDGGAHFPHTCGRVVVNVFIITEALLCLRVTFD